MFLSHFGVLPDFLGSFEQNTCLPFTGFAGLAVIVLTQYDKEDCELNHKLGKMCELSWFEWD